MGVSWVGSMMCQVRVKQGRNSTYLLRICLIIAGFPARVGGFEEGGAVVGCGIEITELAHDGHALAETP